jgi:hypothetical protein
MLAKPLARTGRSGPINSTSEVVDANDLSLNINLKGCG